jgi:nucleoside phosphorylase
MKILIVDDQKRKTDDLARIVREVSPQTEILYATTAADGFRILMEHRPHLVLLDIVLPMNSDDKKLNECSSLWFVQEVKRKVSFPPIPFIVGTTQYAESLAKVQESFRNNLWSVVHVHDSDPRWPEQIVNAVRFAESNAERLSLKSVVKANEVEFAVIAALRNPEFSELVSALGGGEQLSLEETQETWLKCRLNRADGVQISVLAASADEMGMTAMASMVTRICVTCRPKRVILVGIMAGNPDRVGLSDLVIVESTWNSQVGKLTANGFQPDVKSLPCSFSLANALMAVIDEKFILDFWSSWKGSKRPQQVAKTHKGDVACSPFVVADGKTFSQLENEQKRKVIGLEMEAFGLYDAARRLGALAPEVICIKSVCDFGDGAKNDDFQTYCAALSATAAVAFIRNSKALQ